ncbi:hypothetical protein EDC50_1862 [Vulcaniibacterium tengchongense]|uniref:Uncharacterized protein n=1 Tax=Vulcaniibacterium tengchongense TaxID=1273429 RepID=A0A3N4VL93_9GAMM|nr:hypothetical protein [Vulcaniibacterium tengchongense]RPE80031.1 hypothetical protein EDC50_1862 [Vulcaniibacterium tengchongense]
MSPTASAALFLAVLAFLTILLSAFLAVLLATFLAVLAFLPVLLATFLAILLSAFLAVLALFALVLVTHLEHPVCPDRSSVEDMLRGCG